MRTKRFVRGIQFSVFYLPSGRRNEFLRWGRYAPQRPFGRKRVRRLKTEWPWRFVFLAPLLAVFSLILFGPLSAQAQTSFLPIKRTLGRSATTTYIGSPPPGQATVKAVLKASADAILSGQAASLTQFSTVVSSAVNVKHRQGTPPGALLGFAGLNALDSAVATQSVSDPPDQGLAAGNGYVLEAVNDVLAVYEKGSGKLLEGPIDLNSFFGLPPAISVDPVTQQATYGLFLTDPRCYYDWLTKRWFITIAEASVDPQTGVTFTGQSAVLIAVSQSASPTGLWNVYFIDQSGTFPDQPLLGADSNGIYISTNNFPLSGISFDSTANIYAISKAGLINGTVNAVFQFTGLTLAEGSPYSIQPATTPPLCAAAEINQGTEYFMSNCDFNQDGTPVNRIGVWAITNTKSLSSDTPIPVLTSTIVSSEAYALPTYAAQKAGPFSFGTSLGFTEQYLDAGDDRMQQVQYVNGVLWSGLNTILASSQASSTVSSNPFDPMAPDGIAYFAVHPFWQAGSLNGQIVHQGYVVAPNGNSVLYPAITSTYRGKTVMGFTLTGPDHYPSAAFSMFTNGAFGPITIAAEGVAPDDSFSGYGDIGPFGSDGPQVARWGDYSGAVSDTDGGIWLATDCILGPGTGVNNWCTFLTRLPK